MFIIHIDGEEGFKVLVVDVTGYLKEVAAKEKFSPDDYFDVIFLIIFFSGEFDGDGFIFEFFGKIIFPDFEAF